MKTNKEFPNGFTSWQETHFELVTLISAELSKNNPQGEIKDRLEANGIGAMYELAEEWTDEFELVNEDREWDGDFYEEIEEFFKTKNK